MKIFTKIQHFSTTLRIYFGVLVIVLSVCMANNAVAQSNAENIEKWGKFDNWRVREIKESGIIGGDYKYLYEIAKGDTLKNSGAYVNPDGCVWSNSNVYAVVSGIKKTNCSVFPEKRGDGYCARLETRLERVRVLGVINIKVVAAGAMFLGKMLEPIKDTKNPQAKLDSGVEFTLKPKAISFDYKVHVGNNRIKATGFGSPKELGDNDYAECVVMLQKRWEDEMGNVYSMRVGTGYYRFTKSQDSWINGFNVPINYGDVTAKEYYSESMRLLAGEEANYMVNSKGVSVPIQEVGWADESDKPTHIIVRFTSSYGEAYVGDISNKLWIDNVKFIY
ncbi:MAG: PCMD domain-containing protein [Bacteroidia bacterium]|nr:PCMD domain-containing protein [Bacteroidia bacterium]